MKKNLLNIVFAGLIAGLIILSSCSKDEPLPLATANFEVLTTAPEVFLPVVFENLSLNASMYVWDYGDGDLDSANNIVTGSHVYEEPGNYTVKLRAYNDDGAFVEAEETINVGERYMTGLWIISMGKEDVEGNKIDTAGVDAVLIIGQNTNPLDPETIISTDTLFSLGGAENPVPSGFTINFDYLLENESYFIELDMYKDDDIVPLAGFTFNPLNPNITLKDEDGLGGIIVPLITESGYQFLIEFEIL